MIRYFDYFIKYLIRRLTRIILKPRNLIFILIILLILSLFMYSQSFAAESSIYDVYSSINNDLITRLNNIKLTTSFYNYFNNPSYSFFVYYGDLKGVDMFSNQYDSSILNVAFYPSKSPVSNYENTVNWAGVSCNQSRVSSPSFNITVYSFYSNNEYNITDVDYIYLPTQLYNYRSSELSKYLMEQKNVQEITNSITEGTDKINDTVSDTNNFIKDDKIDDNSMNVDTSGYDIEGEASIDNFFTDFMNTIYDKFVNMTSEVETISIPMPYNMNSIELSSDIISKHIKDTPLYSLIQVFWTFVFGSYIVIFVKRIFDWLSTGEIAEKGVFGFIQWLDNYNAIIKSYMM